MWLGGVGYTLLFVGAVNGSVVSLSPSLLPHIASLNIRILMSYKLWFRRKIGQSHELIVILEKHIDVMVAEWDWMPELTESTNPEDRNRNADKP